MRPCFCFQRLRDHITQLRRQLRVRYQRWRWRDVQNRTEDRVTSFAVVASAAAASAFSAFARPKSITFALPRPVTKIFAA
jgi:hypothetical protein